MFGHIDKSPSVSPVGSLVGLTFPTTVATVAGLCVAFSLILLLKRAPSGSCGDASCPTKKQKTNVMDTHRTSNDSHPSSSDNTPTESSLPGPNDASDSSNSLTGSPRRSILRPPESGADVAESSQPPLAPVSSNGGMKKSGSKLRFCEDGNSMVRIGSRHDLSKDEKSSLFYAKADMNSFVRDELARRQRQGIKSMSALAPDEDATKGEVELMDDQPKDSDSTLNRPLVAVAQRSDADNQEGDDGIYF